jgi:glycerol uptake facilitator protein
MTELLKRKTLTGEMLAEFAGTLILILFGCGVVAQVVAGGIGSLGAAYMAGLTVGTGRTWRGCDAAGTVPVSGIRP